MIKQISKGHIEEINPPLVNTACLPVYVSPKMNSIVIANLSWPCEVEIISYKNKKRWVLIKWTDSSGETHQGWTLSRYIYRKNQI